MELSVISQMKTTVGCPTQSNPNDNDGRFEEKTTLMSGKH